MQVKNKAFIPGTFFRDMDTEQKTTVEDLIKVLHAYKGTVEKLKKLDEEVRQLHNIGVKFFPWLSVDKEIRVACGQKEVIYRTKYGSVDIVERGNVRTVANWGETSLGSILEIADCLLMLSHEINLISKELEEEKSKLERLKTVLQALGFFD